MANIMIKALPIILDITIEPATGILLFKGIIRLILDSPPPLIESGGKAFMRTQQMQNYKHEKALHVTIW